jgi:hypothetical protein
MHLISNGCGVIRFYMIWCYQVEPVGPFAGKRIKKDKIPFLTGSTG